MNSEALQDSLKNWKLPPLSASDVYKRSGIFGCSSIIKTVEEEIPVYDGYSSFPLFSDDLRRVYSKKYVYIHIGMIQVALRPTKLGSDASAIICLRKKKSGDFFQSVFRMVESSLSDGPIYFSYFPRGISESCVVSFGDDLSRTVSIDIKTEGCSTDDKDLVLMYRFHYRVLKRQCSPRTRESSNYRVNENGTTTLFLTDTAERNRVSEKKIRWDEIAVPARWVDWKETAEAHVLRVVLPREVEAEEVKVEVEDGSILQIRGKKRCGLMLERNTTGDRYTTKRIIENFGSRIRLPENSKPEQVKVTIVNGVLMVALKREVQKAEVKVVKVSVVN